eukprot:878995-Pelagomonas_calceolata.AAC.1
MAMEFLELSITQHVMEWCGYLSKKSRLDHELFMAMEFLELSMAQHVIRGGFPDRQGPPGSLPGLLRSATHFKPLPLHEVHNYPPSPPAMDSLPTEAMWPPPGAFC